jgi:hypothetical protein
MKINIVTIRPFLQIAIWRIPSRMKLAPTWWIRNLTPYPTPNHVLPAADRLVYAYVRYHLHSHLLSRDVGGRLVDNPYHAELGPHRRRQ